MTYYPTNTNCSSLRETDILGICKITLTKACKTFVFNWRFRLKSHSVADKRYFNMNTIMNKENAQAKVRGNDQNRKNNEYWVL